MPFTTLDQLLVIAAPILRTPGNLHSSPAMCRLFLIVPHHRSKDLFSFRHLLYTQTKVRIISKWQIHFTILLHEDMKRQQEKHVLLLGPSPCQCLKTRAFADSKSLFLRQARPRARHWESMNNVLVSVLGSVFVRVTIGVWCIENEREKERDSKRWYKGNWGDKHLGRILLHICRTCLDPTDCCIYIWKRDDQLQPIQHSMYQKEEQQGGRAEKGGGR